MIIHYLIISSRLVINQIKTVDHVTVFSFIPQSVPSVSNHVIVTFIL